VNVDPTEEDHLEKLYPPHREAGVWSFDAGDDAANLPQLPGRFTHGRDGAVEQGHLGLGRRYLGQGELSVGGIETVYERWEYRDYSELIEMRFRLLVVALRVESWNLTEREILHVAARLERLELGSDLLRRMTEAAAAAALAWEAWHRQRYPST